MGADPTSLAARLPPLHGTLDQTRCRIHWRVDRSIPSDRDSNIVLLGNSVTFDEEFKVKPEQSSTPELVVESYFNAVANNDLAGIEAVVADDFIQHSPPINSQQDRSAFIEEWRQRIAENPDSALKYERVHRISETIADGPRMGTWVHEWGIYRRTDDTLAFKLAASFKVHDGKLVAAHAYFDRLDVMTQAGFTLTPPAG